MTIDSLIREGNLLKALTDRFALCEKGKVVSTHATHGEAVQDRELRCGLNRRSDFVIYDMEAKSAREKLSPEEWK